MSMYRVSCGKTIEEDTLDTCPKCGQLWQVEWFSADGVRITQFAPTEKLARGIYHKRWTKLVGCVSLKEVQDSGILED